MASGPTVLPTQALPTPSVLTVLRCLSHLLLFQSTYPTQEKRQLFIICNLIYDQL